jgi:hypothetical protein
MLTLNTPGTVDLCSETPSKRAEHTPEALPGKNLRIYG